MKRSIVIALILSVGFAVTSCFGPVVRPTVDFTWCPDGSSGMLDYRFSPDVTTVPNHYVASLSWEFGDGTSTEESYWEVTHRFAEEGTYPVTLIATDDRGVSGTVTKNVLVAAAALIRDWQLTLGVPVKVTGEVVNRYSRKLQAVTIKAKFYNADGVRVTQATTEIDDLEPGEIVRFTIAVQEHAFEIFYAKVSVLSFSSDCPNVMHTVYDATDR